MAIETTYYPTTTLDETKRDMRAIVRLKIMDAGRRYPENPDAWLGVLEKLSEWEQRLVN